VNSQSAIRNPNSEILLIRPADGWTSIGLKELCEFRELLYFLTWRDIKVSEQIR
jgi:lipopolysaccharide transport system permease protein